MSDLTYKHYTNICKVMLMEIMSVANLQDHNQILVETHFMRSLTSTIGRLSTTLQAILNMMADNFVILITTPGMDIRRLKEKLISYLVVTVAILNGPHRHRKGDLERLLETNHQDLNEPPNLFTYLRPIIQALIEITSHHEDDMVNLTYFKILQVMS